LILDTNALSAIAEAEPDAVQQLDRAAEVMLPVIVIGEYSFGIRQSRHRVRYEAWLTQMIAKCFILEVNMRTAEEYAEIRFVLGKKGRPIPGNDIWIAALARQYDLPVLTRDRHYDAVPGIRRLTW
jgi:tRNA(fMet)-specific endonuclease VapC